MKIGWSQIGHKKRNKKGSPTFDEPALTALKVLKSRFFPLSFALKGVSGSGGRTILKRLIKAMIKALNKAVNKAYD